MVNYKKTVQLYQYALDDHLTPISNARLAVPEAAAGEILRDVLLKSVVEGQQRFVYVQAGAGYGKTTLLSQLARATEHVVWITADGEQTAFAFLDLLKAAVQRTIPEFSFFVTEYLPYEQSSNFISLLANAFVSKIEAIPGPLWFFLDELHTVTDHEPRLLLAAILKNCPKKIRFFFGSREMPWPEFAPFQMRGSLLTIPQSALVFTREEMDAFIGFHDERLYKITEGWPIAVVAYKVLMENGLSESALLTRESETLHAYLFYEYFGQLPPEMMTFLKSSACLESLDPTMLNVVLGRNNSALLLNSLNVRGIFTIKTEGESYRFHPLFRDYLLSLVTENEQKKLLLESAQYYFAHGQFGRAAECAIKADAPSLLGQIVRACFDDYMRDGAFYTLRTWLETLGDDFVSRDSELLVNKGALLSSIGNFTGAHSCLDQVLPLLDNRNFDLYIKASVHKARVLRNWVSFEESNDVLDPLITQLNRFDTEQAYSVVIEKIFNHLWNSQVDQAYSLCSQAMDACANSGHLRVRAWYERYLSVIHYVAGRMRDAVWVYEKSLLIPEDERQQLEMHSIDIHVAKAYQMLGQREFAVKLVTAGLDRLRSSGRYEELWLGYLMAAEIHYQNISIDRMNGGSQSYDATIQYFSLAEEYAPLYRKSRFQQDWARLQRSIYQLMFIPGEKESQIKEIFASLPTVGDFFKTLALGRLFNYFGSVSDFERAVFCARQAIEVGEKSNLQLIATVAYGLLARIALAHRDLEQATVLVRTYLQLCDTNGIYEYFRVRKAYDPILQFAYDNSIELDFVKRMMDFSGYFAKKIYIRMMGDFSVFVYDDREKPLKLRTRKARELLAFLLHTGATGATKNQIYEAIWYESESNDVKKLIGVNLAQIKKDLSALNLNDLIQNREARYYVLQDELVTDCALFEQAVTDFKNSGTKAAAMKVVSLYGGEYLPGIEAPWVLGKRLAYLESYREAAELCQQVT